MALGDVTNLGGRYAIELLASIDAANGAPSANAGLSADTVRALLGNLPDTMRVGIKSTAGSGTMTVTLKLWMKLGAAGWFVAKALNGGSAIAETGTDTIGYSEEVSTLGAADRYYLEVVSIAGTGTAVTGHLVVAPEG